MAKDVFISYTTVDRELAYKLVDFLESNHISCYIAPRDIDPGMPYASNLTRAISDCRAAVLVASEATNNSQHVLNEVDIMVSKNKLIVPFFIEEFEMNDDYRYYLGRTQRIIADPIAIDAYFPKIIDSIASVLPKPSAPAPAQPVVKTEALVERTKKSFDYIPERGIMINPEDHQRNVSFRTDTFINMFGGIYQEVVNLTGDPAKIQAIFHTSGYTSGQAFAQRLNSHWDLQSNNVLLYAEKLRKWCEFDSDVGWGKFDIDVDVNEETGDFKGKLTINECFIVDTKNKRMICEFIKGYCEGVIETLLGVEVALQCVVCPLRNRFRTTCCFDIIIKE